MNPISLAANPCCNCIVASRSWQVLTHGEGLRRREFISLLGGAAAWPLTARAQHAQKIARIGIVSINGPTADMTGPLPPNRNVRAFLRAMVELG